MAALTTEPDWNRIAAGAYEAYAQVVRAEQQTLAVPAWEELPPRMQEGWREAAQTVWQSIEHKESIE